MECTCKVNQRRLIPAVFNLKQYLNSTETMVWTLDSTLTNNGECDLCEYDAFLALSANGVIDEVMLAKQRQEDGVLKLLWNVGKYATGLKGNVKYQIVFRRSSVEEIGVYGSVDTDANGIYAVNNLTTEGITRIFTNTESGYTAKWNAEGNCWAIYNTSGEIVELQTISNIEPYCGGWKNVIVSNNTAAAWYSDEAIMYISETIAADQSVTANFPTVLRQMWQAVKSMILRSGTAIFEKEIAESDWQGETAPYQLDASIVEIPQGCNVVNIRLLKILNSGIFGDVSNITYTQDATGKVIVFAHEKINGKLTVTVKGGNDYVFIDKEALTGTAATVDYVDEAIKDKADKSELFSGEYSDLSGTPTIPTKTSDLNNDSGFVAKGYVDGLVGDVNTVLDTINGEVI